jgi:hypothetical protein
VTAVAARFRKCLMVPPGLVSGEPTTAGTACQAALSG